MSEPKPLVLTDEDCDDVMDTASYGGITYWASDATPEQKALYKHADYIFWDAEGERVISLTRGQIRSAYFKLTRMTHEARYVADWIHDYFVQANTDRDPETGRPDLGYIDATAADCVVQVAAFGEVIYG